ncbi:MAG: hydroxymethylglutaryl-CoA lyase [Bacteroidetes bacterium]|nr:hydroxymethylglutaryl-CoA lyase [Bacteroidota bacterium]
MTLKLIECPRDAMQGLHHFIPTQTKIDYINGLLSIGFDTIDFGSFVSAKAIPQLLDTAEVLANLDLNHTKSKLLAIIANVRGAENACQHSQIKYLGFPFSISETFQQRNTNRSMADSLLNVEAIQNLCVKNNKDLVIYISMGFGNPYGDVWNVDIVEKWVNKMNQLGVKIISLSDTIGVANPETISYLFKSLIPSLPHIEFGAHLHTTPDTWREKVEAAYTSGCSRFDGAIKGFGGCPMAADDLTGNMPTEKMLQYFDEINLDTGLNKENFNQSLLMADSVFLA